MEPFDRCRCLAAGSPSFSSSFSNNSNHLAATIIHEMLHTLGLGENPPSSEEITAHVRRRCWAGGRSRVSAAIQRTSSLDPWIEIDAANLAHNVAEVDGLPGIERISG